MKDHRKEIYDTDTRRLARIIVEVGNGQESVCQATEMRAVWNHQLHAPLESDLDIPRRELEDLRLGTEQAPETFRELLQSEAPPLELLKMVKDFGKASWTAEGSPLPADIGTVLYFAAVAAARERCDTQITSLSPRQIQRGVKWCMEQDWLDADTRALLKACLKSTSGKGFWPFSQFFER